MNETINTLQQEAARILRENIVDAVIGFTTGSVPLRARPVIIRKPEAASQLILDGFCGNNLAAYLNDRPATERIGIVSRGCESRAVRALIVEQQRTRDTLYIIGMHCSGILDPHKLLSAGGADLLWAREDEHEVRAGTPSGEIRIDRYKLLHDTCNRCRFPHPVGADIIVGEPAFQPDPEAARNRVMAFEALDAEARHDYFAAETARCIRCYACRQACPMCYCTRCFVDHSAPRWTESTISPSGCQAWHLIRAFHQTGRCVSCGACERACPMQIPMTYLTDKLNQDVADNYGFVAGEDEQQAPPFATFSLDDAQRFEG